MTAPFSIARGWIGGTDMFITMYGVVTVGAVATTFHAFFSNKMDAEAFINSDDEGSIFWYAEIRVYQISNILKVGG